MNTKAETSAEFIAYSGIDWADQADAICDLATNGRLPRSHHIDQTPEAIATWIRQLRAEYGPG